VRRCEGFTLIELVLVIVVSSILGGFTLGFIDTTVKTYRMMRTETQLEEEGAYALERITRELRDASFVYPAINSNSLNFIKSHVTPQDPANIFIRYYLSGTDLFRCSTASGGGSCSTNKIIASNVSSFVANGATNGPFSIDLILQKEEPSIRLRPMEPLVLRISLSTLVKPQNYIANFNGNWQDVIKQ
jgi:prepilin-type N-terminal cleavage/methylation domain-containing protein